jgi:hypothetical protein
MFLDSYLQNRNANAPFDLGGLAERRQFFSNDGSLNYVALSDEDVRDMSSLQLKSAS